MSALVVIVRRDGGPVSRRRARRLLAALEHRGRDGANLVWRPSAALGVQHFWTTSEDRGEVQPVADPRSGVDVLFEGRLDNRWEILDSLPMGEGHARVSDAKLALLAYRHWGRRCFQRLLGPFAMIVFDAPRHRLICARDAVGDRTLCYHLGSEELVVASEAAALLRHPAVSSSFDETTLARFFAVEAPLPGATFFADVSEIPPGHTLTFEEDRLRLERFWRPEDLPEVRYRRDSEYVEHFRQLLAESVRCRLRGPSPPAVLMSGGLDSTSVAALAATELAADGSGARLTTVSWVFDELSWSDERRFMDPVVERYDLDACRIVGDGEWPLRDLESWPIDANSPWQGLYRRLYERAYAATRRAGAASLLTGELGDHLYLAQIYWLRDLIREGRWAEGRRELEKEMGGERPWALVRAGRARSAVARALGWRGSPGARPRWLTAYARRRLGGSHRLPAMLDPRAAAAASLEIAAASRAGVEVRRPYRDRRLIELMLQVPAHLSHRPGSSKWILRQAVAGVLPEEVRLRQHVSSLLPLAARGLLEEEREAVRRVLTAPDAIWRRYVRSDWLAKTFPGRLRSRLDGIETVVPWQCVCAELWAGNRTSKNRPTVHSSQDLIP